MSGDTPAPQQLDIALLREFAKGTLTATQVQSLAGAAWADRWGRGCGLSHRLAHAGASGRHGGNCLRDILKAADQAGLMQGMSKPYIIQAPGAKGRVIDITMYLPHEALFYLVQNDGGDVETWCLTEEQIQSEVGLGRVLREWLDHPDVSQGLNPRRCAIIGMHCDGVQYTSTMRAGGAKSVLVCPFNVISAQQKQRRMKRHLFCLVRKASLCTCGCAGFCTLQAIWKAFAWSMGCSMTGRAPHERHDGAPWTESDVEDRLEAHTVLPHGALLQIRGDWEWYCQAFRFRLPTQEVFCWKCSASKTGVNTYLNMEPEAPHRTTVYSHSDYIAACLQEGQDLAPRF